MIGHTLTELRQLALSVFQSGIDAADPARAVQACIRVQGDTLGFLRDPCNDRQSMRTGCWSAVHVIAVGKAAIPMAQSARNCLPPQRLAGNPLVVTSYENVTHVAGLDILGASHPMPDEQGMQAAKAIISRLDTTRPGELVLALISGGASALVPLPVPQISLDDKIATTGLLLACGANINEINCVRKHLSRLKGGQMVRHAAPADVQGLLLSDVLGDDLSSIASGPTVPDPTGFDDALAVFSSRNLLHKLPVNVSRYLEQGAEGLHQETPGPDDALFDRVENALVGSNRISLEAVKAHLELLGFQTRVFSDALSGEARDAALAYSEAALTLDPHRPSALIAGGETTVTLRGNGKGGRNQEFALAFAMHHVRACPTHRWVFASGGTDGIDGPTDAAGGIVDGTTLERLELCGLEPRAVLDNNDAYHGLQASDDLIMTGATGTNVADLQVFLSVPDQSFS